MSLAVIAPQIGALSETFIRRHMEDLLPGDTVVITSSDSPPYSGHWNVECPKLIFNRFNLIEQGFGKVAKTFFPGYPRFGLPVKRFLREHNVNVILGEYLSYPVCWLPLAQKLGIPFFAHAHGMDVSTLLRQNKWQIEYMRYNQADAIITVNQVQRHRLIKLGLKPEKIHVIPCGVTVPFQPFIRNNQREIVRCIAVGRMVAKKAPLLMLDAFRQATEVYPDLHLDYIGTGPFFKSVQKLIRGWNLEQKVTLHGGQPNQLVLQLMKEADIFIQHSMTDPKSGDEEGLPVGILEAMAYSLPVVSTYHTGIPEAVKHGETGLLVEEGNSKKMAEYLITLAHDAHLRTQMGKAGWQRAQQHFSWEVEAEQLRHVMGLK
ncbi:glycosyltransferase family 4 protein [Nostoc sp.]|uniref:glycosyltransferase family 4 protein n=1 Tax=Nostoc sp. TaxID=1180 RepID=UPI002FF9561F